MAQNEPNFKIGQIDTSSSSSRAKSFQERLGDPDNNNNNNIENHDNNNDDDLYSGRWVRRPRRRRVQCQHHKQRALRTWHHICQLCPIQYFWRSSDDSYILCQNKTNKKPCYILENHIRAFHYQTIFTSQSPPHHMFNPIIISSNRLLYSGFLSSEPQTSWEQDNVNLHNISLKLVSPRGVVILRSALLRAELHIGKLAEVEGDHKHRPGSLTHSKIWATGTGTRITWDPI